MKKRERISGQGGITADYQVIIMEWIKKRYTPSKHVKAVLK